MRKKVSKYQQKKYYKEMNKIDDNQFGFTGLFLVSFCLFPIGPIFFCLLYSIFIGPEVKNQQNQIQNKYFGTSISENMAQEVRNSLRKTDKIIYEYFNENSFREEKSYKKFGDHLIVHRPIDQIICLNNLIENYNKLSARISHFVEEKSNLQNKLEMDKFFLIIKSNLDQLPSTYVLVANSKSISKKNLKKYFSINNIDFINHNLSSQKLFELYGQVVTPVGSSINNQEILSLIYKFRRNLLDCIENFPEIRNISNKLKELYCKRENLINNGIEIINTFKLTTKCVSDRKNYIEFLEKIQRDIEINGKRSVTGKLITNLKAITDLINEEVVLIKFLVKLREDFKENTRLSLYRSGFLRI